MAGIRASSIIKSKNHAIPTARDRASLDFSRYPPKPTEKQPTKGISFQALLEIASNVCGRRITELTQVTSVSDMKEIRRRMRVGINR
jgi:hypothetical protein